MNYQEFVSEMLKEHPYPKTITVGDPMVYEELLGCFDQVLIYDPAAPKDKVYVQ